MNNAEKFNEVFDIYATELWAKSEAELLEWLWGEYGAVEAGGESGVMFNYRTPKRDAKMDEV